MDCRQGSIAELFDMRGVAFALLCSGCAGVATAAACHAWRWLHRVGAAPKTSGRFELDPNRRVVEQDCSKPIEDPSANLKCRWDKPAVRCGGPAPPPQRASTSARASGFLTVRCRPGADFPPATLAHVVAPVARAHYVRVLGQLSDLVLCWCPRVMERNLARDHGRLAVGQA
jgi:hypothetical protein